MDILVAEFGIPTLDRDKDRNSLKIQVRERSGYGERRRELYCYTRPTSNRPVAIPTQKPPNVNGRDQKHVLTIETQYMILSNFFFIIPLMILFVINFFERMENFLWLQNNSLYFPKIYLPFLFLLQT